jgi:hypothetical protein
MLPIIKSTWAGMGKNLGLGSEKPPITCLSYGKAKKSNNEGGVQGDPKFPKYGIQNKS